MVKFSVLPIASKRAQRMQAAKLCIAKLCIMQNYFAKLCIMYYAKLCIARELCTITIVIANHGKSL